jgi:hypothetical protein
MSPAGQGSGPARSVGKVTGPTPAFGKSRDSSESDDGRCGVSSTGEKQGVTCSQSDHDGAMTTVMTSERVKRCLDDNTKVSKPLRLRSTCLSQGRDWGEAFT